MIARVFKILLVLALVSSVAEFAPEAAAQESIRLPDPVKTGGLPLNEALAARHSARKFKPDQLSRETLSGILWAAFGVNREDGKRTIPTARGKNELQVYAVLSTGVYLYDPEKNTLELALEGDFTKNYDPQAPLTLLYAAPDKVLGGLHAGSAYQSVGLYAASSGLSNVVKVTGVDELKDKLKLPEGYAVLAVHTLGLPD
ncbi:MAG: nitroreductase family protein [Deltaproteobacteria bacterium]|nr:nitroreductase family protein [Deltaproteobacteria bacterium]